MLVYTLVFDAWEPGRSAMAAVISGIAVGVFQPATRPTLRKLWIACIETGRTLLDLVAIVAIAGLVIGALQISGLAFSLSLILTSLAERQPVRAAAADRGALDRAGHGACRAR